MRGSPTVATLPRLRFAAPVTWRPLVDDDLAYVAALKAQIHAAPWTLGNFRDALAAGYLAQAGEREARIVAYGVLMLAPGEAQVLNVSVVPDARREGLGRALLDRFMRDAAQRGAEQIFLRSASATRRRSGCTAARASSRWGGAPRTILPTPAARTRMRWCCAARCGRPRGKGGS